MLASDPYQTNRISHFLTLIKELHVSKYMEKLLSYFFNIYTNRCSEISSEEVFEYTPQSGALGTIQESGVADLTAEITNFQEQDAGYTTTIGAGSDPTMNLVNNADS